MAYYNPYVVIPLLAWFISQLIKFIRNALKNKVDFNYFYYSGEMPSAHSATVSSLATTALIFDGFMSPLFGISLVFAATVMYDSFGVRRSSGDQAIAINAILRTLPLKRDDSLLTLRMREIIGHKPIEVLAGAIVGVVAALVMSIPEWSSDVAFLTKASSSVEQWAYLGLFSLLALVTLGVGLVFSRKRFARVNVIAMLKRTIRISFSLFAGVGLGLSLLQFQGIETAEWRLWPALLIALFFCLQTYLYIRFYRTVPMLYQTQQEVLLQKRSRSAKPKKRR